MVFYNVVWDLRTCQFGPSKPDDFISDQQTAGVVFELREEKIRFLKEQYVQKILPQPEIRHSFLAHLATGLCGQNQKYLLISYGPSAGNAKTALSSLMLCALGKSSVSEHYGKKMHASMLTWMKADQASLHTLDCARYVIIEEPDSRRPLNGATIKDNTNGSSDSAARGFHSENCNVTLMLTLHMNCNIIPSVEPMDAGVENRLRIFEFNSCFVSDETKVDEEHHIYMDNKELMQDPWQSEHAMQFLHLLREYLPEYYDNYFTVRMTTTLRATTEIFVSETDQFVAGFFLKYYEFVDDPNELVYCRDVIQQLKTSEYWFLKERENNGTKNIFRERKEAIKTVTYIVQNEMYDQREELLQSTPLC